MSYHKFRLAAFVLFSVPILLSGVQAASACNASTGCYGAVAVGNWRLHGHARTAIGAAVNFSSRREARNAAMSECNKKGYNCRAVGTFSNGGCGYITVGNASWGTIATSSSTRNGAYNRCVSQGYNCDEPIGGCTSKVIFGD